MPTYLVEVTRSISTTVQVEADSAQAAVDMVAGRDFPLPPRDTWDGLKDWFFRATNASRTGDTYETD